MEEFVEAEREAWVSERVMGLGREENERKEAGPIRDINTGQTRIVIESVQRRVENFMCPFHRVRDVLG